MAEAISRENQAAGGETAVVHATQEQYHRFDLSQRIEHGVLILSFTILGITGIPQMYPDSLVGNWILTALGGIQTNRIIHRVAAAILIVLSIYHAGSVAYRLLVQRVQWTMLPTWKDVQDGVQSLGHNLGLIKNPPAMPRYDFAEKMEYWAVIWGTVIMILTGFMLWNPIATTNFLPGQFVPVAKAAHGGEALLAVLAIVTWHLYHVHVKSFNKSMFTGYLDAEAMEEEHALELAEIENGPPPVPTPPEVLRRRKAIFFPIATVITLLLLAGLFWFLTFEQTAITTVPRQAVETVVPAGN
jgi:cytochrome b subunit of formate dehydrogenase